MYFIWGCREGVIRQRSSLHQNFAQESRFLACQKSMIFEHLKKSFIKKTAIRNFIKNYFITAQESPFLI